MLHVNLTVPATSSAARDIEGSRSGELSFNDILPSRKAMASDFGG